MNDPIGIERKNKLQPCLICGIECINGDKPSFCLFHPKDRYEEHLQIVAMYKNMTEWEQNVLIRMLEKVEQSLEIEE